jgi:trans-aconitate methyltransferase
MTIAFPDFARKLWARIWLRRSQFSGRYGQLKALYAIEDPWDLTSDREQERYVRMNALIRELVPDCRELLELGSGEGLQTRRLLEVSEHVTGVELSAQAVERAKARCPQATFIVGRAEEAASLVRGRRFDLVTAFEVLYYARDVAAILADLQPIAPVILVTNYMDLASRMERYFDGAGWTRLDDIAIEDIVWRVDVWRAQEGAGST